MERIDKLIKLPVSVNDSYKIIDADGLYILEVGVPYILTDKDKAINEALRDLINGQSVDGIADIYKRDYTGVATNLDGISESVCKAEKCDAPNCYEGQEPKGCLMEGAHKPVVDVQKMAEDDLDKLFERYESETGASVFATNFFKGWLKKNLHGSTLSQSWVSVEEKLPEDGQFVLCCNIDTDVYLEAHEYSSKYNTYRRYTSSCADSIVTHWQPLPSPPKEITPLKPQTMEDKELEQNIITVMKFDGWKAMKNPENPDLIWHHSKYGHIYSDYDITDFTYYHTSWEWIHSAWEKFREEKFEPVNQMLEASIPYYQFLQHKNKVGKEILGGTPLEAFTALYEAIKWFNELNKEG